MIEQPMNMRGIAKELLKVKPQLAFGSAIGDQPRSGKLRAAT